MADSTFNPYRQWLGIQDHELPANYYRLLGLVPFEQDPARIAAAAERMIAHVRAISPGERVADWQRLIGELGAARQCLTDPRQKTAYDAHLHQQFQQDSTPAAPVHPQAWPPGQPTASAPSPAPSVPGGSYPQAQPVYHPGGPPVARPVGAPGARPMMGNPMAPVARPVAAIAQAAAVPDLGIPSGGSSRVSARLRKKSNAPLVIALCAVAGFVTLVLVLVLNQEKWMSPAKPPAPPVVAQAPPRKPPPPVPAAPPAKPKPASAKSKPAPAKTEPMPSSGGIPIPGLDYNRGPMSDAAQEPDARPDAQAPPAAAPPPPAAEANASEKMPPADLASMNEPGMTEPGMAEPEVTVPEMTPPETSVATPRPMPQPEPAASKQPTPEQAAAFDRALRAAYDALAGRDVAAAKRELAAAEPLAIGDKQQSRLRGMQLVLQGVESFWNAAREGLKGLIGTSDDLELESGTRIGIVEAAPDFLILRIAGRNRRYEFADLPSGLAMLLAKRWFDAAAPSTKVFLGAFHFVDPRGDKEDVRRLWETAGREGVAIDDLMPLLDMKK